MISIFYNNPLHAWNETIIRGYQRDILHSPEAVGQYSLYTDFKIDDDTLTNSRDDDIPYYTQVIRQLAQYRRNGL